MNAERDRDRLLEDALTHQLRSSAAAPAGDACLDAETLAAWMDGGLEPQAIVLAEAHASNCARCQALLATVARTTPAAAVAEPVTARLWRWWLAPLVATAAAVTLWMVVPQDRLTAPAGAPAIESPAPETSVAKSEATLPAAPPPAAAPALPEAASRESAARDRNAPLRAEATAPKREAQSFEARERPAETANLADTAVAGRIAEAAPVPPPPPSPLPPPAAPPAPAAAAQQAKVVAEEQVIAQSAPSPTVIWQVGRAGLVQVATDGKTFVRLPFPEAVDLTAVTATDERHASVTTADGRVFQTADAGRTWQQRP